MPHVIYLHSALTQRRVVGKTEEEKRKIFRFELVDVVIAMAIAGTINASMLIMAAALFHSAGLTGVGDIDKAFEQLRILEGNTPAILFGVALLASGLSSSSVGTLSGQVVMQGFISRQIPLFLRRLITMMPALIILAIGLNPSRSLVISQVASRSRSFLCSSSAATGTLWARSSTTGSPRPLRRWSSSSSSR
jgi:manganese transport protein